MAKRPGYRTPAQRVRDAADRAHKSPLLARVEAAGPRGLVLFGTRELADAVDCYEHGLLACDDGDHWTLTSTGAEAVATQRKVQGLS